MVDCCFHRNHKPCCLWNARLCLQTSASVGDVSGNRSARLSSEGEGCSKQHGRLTRAPFQALDICVLLFLSVVGGNLSSWRLWVWCLTPKSSQDLLHSPWRRWPWHGAHRSVSSGLLVSEWLRRMKQYPQTCYSSHWGFQVSGIRSYAVCLGAGGGAARGVLLGCPKRSIVSVY